MGLNIARAHRKSFRRALLLSLITSILSGAIYSEILKSEDTSVPVLPSIPLGDQSFVIVSNDLCVGSVGSSLKYDGSYLLKTDLELRVSARNAKQAAKVSLTGEFNSLGQLGGSIADLQFNDHSMRFGTIGVNPAQLVFRYTDSAGKVKNFTKSVPGPIEIYPDGKDQYRIRYRYMPVKQIKAQATSGLPLAFEELALEVLPVEDFNCDQDRYLNLDPLISAFEKLANRYRLLLGLVSR